MRKFLLLFALCAPLAVFAQGKACFPHLKEAPFQGGENVSLSLMYKWGAVNTEVAQCVIKVENSSLEGQPCYKTDVTVKSAPFFDIFFKMREHFESWFTKDDLRPLVFKRDTFEGGYTAVNDYHYDWDAGVIHADVNFSSRGRQILDLPLEGCVYDLPALIYNLRAMDISSFVVGKRMPLRFAIDDEVYDIFLTYKGEEVLKVRKMGKVKAHHFSCSVVQGEMFEGNEDVQFWFTADENVLPLAVMAPLRVGAMWGWLRNYEGLKYDFTARQ